MTDATSRLTVQKLKLQLFHRLQRRHRDSWKRYWGAFQLYLAAKLSLEEFHALAEELLGPDKHLHNKFVVALLSTSFQQTDDDVQPPPPPERQDHNGGGGGRAEAGAIAVEMENQKPKDPLLQIIKEEGARHVCGDSEQRLSVTPDTEVQNLKRPHSSVDSAHEDAVVNKHLTAASRDRSLTHDDHSDHQSAALLIGLGKCSSTSPSSIALTPGSTPSNRSFEAQLSSGTDNRRG
ncbi:hypothetical protein PHYBOEH_005510 [Phytophthora boehmeriae]|uniref:Uncharacterized protein n=1 Tax=Phytophthora boehmeriae TaxID=109152 RepID=A0A8T1X2K1_9STRA|nr:hypothetical protein PHYBOEH_005510 [Phytophthora boehmeriae]